MRGTFFFVHGTGVRLGYDALWNTIQERAKRTGFDDVKFVGCPWGPQHGADLSRLPLTLPPEDLGARAIGAPPTDAELAVARWALLLEDPRFELRVAAQQAPRSTGPSIGTVGPDQRAVAMVANFSAFAMDVAETGLTTAELADAAGAIANSAELGRAALAAGNASDPELVEAVARAIVAQALAAHRDDPPGTGPGAAVNSIVRDRLVTAIDGALVLGARGVATGWLRDRIIDFAKPRLTDYFRGQRDPLTRAWASGAADIIYYQRRGEKIVRYVTDMLADQPDPIVAVCHSLGGEVMTDVLSQDPRPPVKLLVTAGSQPSLFYAVNALAQPNDRAVPFTPWLNFFDRNDFLSYTAQRIFTGVQGIRDIEVDSGVPFPESHGAYWHNDFVYQRIRDNWPP